MKRFVLFSLFSIIFFGCNVPVNYYVRNLTDEPVEISLIKDDGFSVDMFEFKYSNKELPIKFDTHKDLNESVKQESDNNEVRLTILPHSTHYLGFGSNFRQVFKKAVIYKGSESKTIGLTDTEGLQVSRSFISKYAVWFDIK
ncbi:hypothetical protein FNH22_21795 [Fulvivirga sp. M361]|uniref:hypothetical protein n=1 Tax=Fulvivirga sp. M361 TaxID=2594266 RepID=UPI00117BC61A|nr:hypothetical protein [Fulvivirga sp. M361]TRX52350.1 hypothetical protein FNH22_21795 [Fulvivirga sp. M361]